MANDHFATTRADPMEPERLGLFPWLQRLLFGNKAPTWEDDDVSVVTVRDGRTDEFNVRLALLGIAMLLILAARAFAAGEIGPALTFFVWGAAGAFCAYLIGLMMGLLFGLPSTRGWSTRNVMTQGGADGRPLRSAAVVATEGQGGAPLPQPPATTPGSDDWREPDIPYDENTSLEQIADWLTKIIVGVGLTQFNSGRIYFNELALALTRQMLGDGETNPVAGGVILIGFGSLGFLMAYLWMRRYFIPEMVIARRSALLEADAASIARTKKLRLRAAEAENSRLREEANREAENLRRQLEAYKRQGAVQEKPSSSSETVEGFRRRLEEIRQRASKLMKDPLADLIAEPVADPEDPWRSRFGGQSEANGFALTGTVSAFDGEPSLFVVDLAVTAQTEERREQVAGAQTAQFFLHPTFDPMSLRVAFNPNGVAPLKIVAFGAFTVGVLLEDGETKLELNLASLDSAKQFPVFFSR